MHPAAYSRNTGGLAIVGRCACPGFPAGIFGGGRAQWLSLPDAVQLSRLAHAPLSSVDCAVQLRLSGCGRDNASVTVFPAAVSRSVCERTVADRYVAHAQAASSGHQGKSLRKYGVLPKMDTLFGAYVEHYHRERCHQGLGNAIPFLSSLPTNDREGPIACRERLGGLLKYSHHQAV